MDDAKDYQLITSSSYHTRLDACERILARHGFIGGLGKECIDVYHAISSRDPENPEPYEVKKFGKAVKLLQKHVADTHLVNYETCTRAQLGEVLLKACSQFSCTPNMQLLETLLDLGADHEVADKWGRTAFFLGTSPYSFRVLMMFIKHGADINSVYQHPKKEFHTSVWLQCVDWAEPEEARFMLAQGADINATNSEGQNALHRHCDTRAYVEVARDLVDAGVDINGRDDFDATPLNYLCRWKGRRTETVAYLLAQGADPKLEDRSGKTPLHHAASIDKATRELTLLLLDAGALPDEVDEEGNTALHVAVLRTNKAVLEALVEHGADPTLLNAEGKTACELAIDKGYVDIALVLDNNADEIYRQRPEFAELKEIKLQIIASLKVGKTFYRADKEGYTTFLFDGTCYVTERYHEGRTPPLTQTIDGDDQALAWLYERFKHDRWVNKTELSLYKAILERLRH